jgi:hypothetical protein
MYLQARMPAAWPRAVGDDSERTLCAPYRESVMITNKLDHSIRSDEESLVLKIRQQNLNLTWGGNGKEFGNQTKKNKI